MGGHYERNAQTARRKTKRNQLGNISRDDNIEQSRFRSTISPFRNTIPFKWRAPAMVKSTEHLSLMLRTRDKELLKNYYNNRIVDDILSA